MTTTQVTVEFSKDIKLDGVYLTVEMEVDADVHYYPGDRITPPDGEVEYGTVTVRSVDDRKPTETEIAYVRAWMDAEYDWSGLDEEAYCKAN